MIKGTKEYLDGIAKNFTCPEHQTPVVVAWHAGENSYVLRCGVGTHKETAPPKPGETSAKELVVPGHFPEEVTRQPSLTSLYKQGVDIPEPIKSNVEKGIRTRAAKAERQGTAVTFTGMPATDLGTGELLVPVVIQGLIAYAERYHLDPSRSHVVLMYGKPYITIDGYLYHANKSKKPYTIASRPLNTEEFNLFQIPDAAHAWLATVQFPGVGNYVTGLGVVTKEEMEAKSPRDQTKLRSPVVAAHPWQLAQKRAEWQALRRAFPIGETEEDKEE